MSRLTLIVLLFSIHVELGAQSAGSDETPRTSRGAPDFRGVYVNSTLTPLERRPELGNKEFYRVATAPTGGLGERRRLRNKFRDQSLPQAHPTAQVGGWPTR